MGMHWGATEASGATAGKMEEALAMAKANVA